MADATARSTFNKTVAPRIAAAIGVPEQSSSGRSDRFAYFEDDDHFLVVAGPQEGADVDLALVYGMTWAAGRRLVLALPPEHCTATRQRLPWLAEERRPELWLVSGDGIERADAPSRTQSVAALSARLDGGTTRDEFIAAATALHLGEGGGAVGSLVDWATAHADLDPAHRRDQRSWHCMGQRVLSIHRSRGGLRVLAGIHGSTDDRAPVTIEVGPGGLPAEDCARARAAVEQAMQLRLAPGDALLHRRDEHWLQSVLRRSPELVGIEQPALREVPAWRPQDTPVGWRRGYLDLVGLDGHGDIRLVETKLSSNDDPRLVVQGLDYLTWAHAYRDVLGERLGASPDARLGLHLVIGSASDDDEETVALPRYSAALLENLAEEVTWTVQAVHNWFGPANEPHGSTALPRTLPAEWAVPVSTGRNPFQNASRAAAVRWKASSESLPESARRPGAYRSSDPDRTYDFCLPADYATYNLLPTVRAQALELFARLSLSWHGAITGGPTNHLLSSQVQCINALTRMVRDPGPLKAAFGEELDVAEVLPIDGDDLLTFEFIGSDVLGESRGGRRRRGAGSTSVDAAFRYLTSAGRTELALVEWKYTEEYRRGRPLALVGDDVRRQRYLPLWEAEDGPLRTDIVPFDDMLAEPFYQLMRQQLLARELERRHELEADVVRVVHVLSPANDAYQESLTRESHRRAGATVEEVWSALLRRPDRYIRLNPTVFLDPTVTSDEYVARYSPAGALS